MRSWPGAYRVIVGYDTPEAAVLDGDRTSALTTIAATEHCGGYALRLMTDPAWPAPNLVWCAHDGEGWREVAAGTGRLQWQGDEAGTGVLALWGPCAPGVAAYVVTAGATERTVAVQDGYWLCAIETLRAPRLTPTSE